MSARRQKHTKFVDELTTGHVPLDESVTPLVELTSDATAAQTASTSTSTTSSSSSSSSSSTSTASVVKVGAPKSTKQAASSSSDDDGSGNNDETNLTTSEATALLSSTDQSAGRIIRKSDSAGTSRGGDVPIVGRGFANIDRADSGTMSVASGAGSYQEIVDTKRTLVKDDSEQDANEKSDDAGKAKTDSGSSRFLHTAETTPPIDRRVIAAESPLRKTSIGTGVTDVSSAAGVDAVIVMTTTTVTATTSVVSAPASSSVSTAASPSTGEHRRRSREAGKRKAGAKSPSKPRRASAVASSDVAGEFVTDTKSTKRTSSGERHRKKHVAGGGDGTRKHHSAPARAEGVTATTASVSSTPAADIDDDDARSLLRALDSRRLAPILKSPGRVSVRASTRKYSVRWPDARTDDADAANGTEMHATSSSASATAMTTTISSSRRRVPLVGDETAVDGVVRSNSLHTVHYIPYSESRWHRLVRRQRLRLYVGCVCVCLIVIVLALIVVIAVRGAEVLKSNQTSR